MGSFTDWQPVALEPLGDGWWGRLFGIQPGLQELNIRIQRRRLEGPRGPPLSSGGIRRRRSGRGKRGRRRVRAAGTAVLAAAALALAACSGPEPAGQNTVQDVALNREFRLRLGETARVSGLLVTFTDVPQDSRCPLGVLCIWAGNGTVGAHRADRPAHPPGLSARAQHDRRLEHRLGPGASTHPGRTRPGPYPGWNPEGVVSGRAQGDPYPSAASGLRAIAERLAVSERRPGRPPFYVEILRSSWPRFPARPLCVWHHSHLPTPRCIVRVQDRSAHRRLLADNAVTPVLAGDPARPRRGGSYAIKNDRSTAAHRRSQAAPGRRTESRRGRGCGRGGRLRRRPTREATIPAGTRLMAALDQTVSTEHTDVGQDIELRTTDSA